MEEVVYVSYIFSNTYILLSNNHLCFYVNISFKSRIEALHITDIQDMLQSDWTVFLQFRYRMNNISNNMLEFPTRIHHYPYYSLQRHFLVMQRFYLNTTLHIQLNHHFVPRQARRPNTSGMLLQVSGHLCKHFGPTEINEPKSQQEQILDPLRLPRRRQRRGRSTSLLRGNNLIGL